MFSCRNKIARSEAAQLSLLIYHFFSGCARIIYASADLHTSKKSLGADEVAVDRSHICYEMVRHSGIPNQV